MSQKKFNPDGELCGIPYQVMQDGSIRAIWKQHIIQFTSFDEFVGFVEDGFVSADSTQSRIYKRRGEKSASRYGIIAACSIVLALAALLFFGLLPFSNQTSSNFKLIDDRCLAVAKSKLPAQSGMLVVDSRVVSYEGHQGSVTDTKEWNDIQEKVRSLRSDLKRQKDEATTKLEENRRFPSVASYYELLLLKISITSAGIDKLQTKLDWYPKSNDEMRRIAEFNVRSSGELKTHAVICAWNKSQPELLQTHYLGIMNFSSSKCGRNTFSIQFQRCKND